MSIGKKPLVFLASLTPEELQSSISTSSLKAVLVFTHLMKKTFKLLYSGAVHRSKNGFSLCEQDTWHAQQGKLDPGGH